MTEGKDIHAVKLGRKGGQNSRMFLDPAEATALGRKAVKARWDAYYEAHPEKLKEKQEKDARKRLKKQRKRRT